jgi:Tfp pilus assembly protein PilO
MTLRDRLVIMGIAVLAIVGLAWMMVVSPERKKAHEAAAEVEAAQSKLTAAHSQLGNARAAQAKSAVGSATIAQLGKAVPTDKEVPSLIYELTHASKQQNVELSSITAGSNVAPEVTGFTQVPFKFTFTGSYFHLANMFRRLSDLTTRTSSGAIKANGRLVTIQSIGLTSSTSALNAPLTATVTATVYALPPEQGGAGATPASSPAGGSSGDASSSPTAPATIKASP